MNNSTEVHFDKIADSYDYYKVRNKYYYDKLKLLIKDLIVSAKEKSVLECGCGTGDILSFLMPQKGVGFDLSENMISLAKEKYRDKNNLFFMRKNIEREIVDVDGVFDYVLMIDILEHLKNPALVLENIKKIMQKDTKLIITTANKKWARVLYILEKLKLKMPEGEVHWLSLNEILCMLKQQGFEIVERGYRLLIPTYAPFSETINNNFYRNKFLEKLGLVQFIVAKVAT